MVSSFEILEVDGDFPWDSHVESSPYGCFSHLAGWVEALQSLTRSRLYRLAIRKGNEVVGLCPIFFQKRGPLRKAYSPPPQGATHHMGPLLIGHERLAFRKRALLVRDFHRTLDEFLLNELGCNYVEMKYPPQFMDARPLLWAGYSVSPLYTHILDLTQGVDQIWSNCRHELRRNVRKCEGHVTSREASPDELSSFYHLVRKRYEEVGVKYPFSEAYLHDLFRSLGPQHIRLFVTEESGEVRSGLIIVEHRHRATIWHGAPRPQDSRLPINDHLHWVVMCWAEQEGFRELELMDADSPRLEEFKSKFNPQLVPCLHVERSRIWYRFAERIGRDTYSLL